MRSSREYIFYRTCYIYVYVYIYVFQRSSHHQYSQRGITVYSYYYRKSLSLCSIFREHLIGLYPFHVNKGT